MEILGGSWILHRTLVKTDFRAILKQSVSSIDSPVWKDNRVSLDIALRVMCIRQLSGKLVELCRTYWTHGSGSRTSISCTASMFGVTRWRLEGGQAG